MTANRKRILVIESDPAMRFALSRLSFGPGIELKFKAPDEWETAEQGYTAVLADDSILGGTERELPVAVLKEKLSCPIIVMTTSQHARFHHFAKEAGATAVLAKPFSTADLRRTLGESIGTMEITTPAALPAHENTSPVTKSIDFSPADYGGRIATEDAFDQLFVELEKRQPLEEGLDAFDVVERHLVRRALQACAGNQSQTARFLGITRNTLRKRIRKYGLAGLLSNEETAE